MIYMIIERFRDGEARPVYERFRDRGRLAPHGLQYVSSWVTPDLTRCYQVMECADRAAIDVWIAAWADFVHCEVIPVITRPRPQSEFSRPSRGPTILVDSLASEPGRCTGAELR